MEIIKGYIWYADRYHSGTEEDFDAFLKSHPDTKLIFTFDKIKSGQLSKLSENLNASNERKISQEGN